MKHTCKKMAFFLKGHTYIIFQENFTSLCGFKTLDGVDLFLMDEFGVSQQEYMSQHLKSVCIAFLF